MKLGLLIRKFLISVIFRRGKMSETSVMNAMDDVPPSIGYRNVHEICRRTYGKETKAHTDNPHFPTHNVNWGYPTQERLKGLWLQSLKILQGYGALVVV